jgi:hypothetical protein
MIREDGRVTDPVIVWDEENVLIDGHTRAALHAKLTAEGLKLPPLAVFRRSFASKEAAIKYVFTRCETMREMTAARRAFHWIEAHKSDLDAMAEQARMNQAHGLNGDSDDDEPEHGLDQCAKTPPDDKPKSPVNLRKDAAESAGVNQKDMGAALKLLKWQGDDRLTPREHGNLVELRKEWEKGLVGYRTVESEIKKLADKQLVKTRKDAALREILPPAPNGAMLDKIIQCDNLDALRKIPDNSVTLFMTSPPYPLENYEYAGHNGYLGDSIFVITRTFKKNVQQLICLRDELPRRARKAVAVGASR